MRRVVSVILFVLGGWVLSSGAMMAWIDLGEATGIAARVFAFGAFALFSAPFLLGALWASPGNRLAELGLTLMIIAAIGAGLALMMFVVMNDPSIRQAMPPDQPMPQFRFAPLSGAVSLLLLGGGGFALRRWGIPRQREKPALEKVFD